MVIILVKEAPGLLALRKTQCGHQHFMWVFALLFNEVFVTVRQESCPVQRDCKEFNVSERPTAFKLGFESRLCPISDLTSQNLTFLICKMGSIQWGLQQGEDSLHDVFKYFYEIIIMVSTRAPGLN